jgi:hypothetical protein
MAPPSLPYSVLSRRTSMLKPWCHFELTKGSGELLSIITETQSFERPTIYSACIVKGVFHSIQHKFPAYPQAGLPEVEMTCWLAKRNIKSIIKRSLIAPFRRNLRQWSDRLRDDVSDGLQPQNLKQIRHS